MLTRTSSYFTNRHNKTPYLSDLEANTGLARDLPGDRMDTLTRWRSTGGLLLLALLSAPSQAADWNIVLNGKSVHIDAANDWNESNWGLGFEREFDTDARWVKVALGNGFRDSRDHMSYMAGGGIKRRFRPRRLANEFYVDVGVVGFVMTRRDVSHNKPFPGVLPALTVGTRNVAVNLTYLPESMAERATNVSRVDPDVNGILFLQLKFDARLFGFGRRGRTALAASD